MARSLGGRFQKSGLLLVPSPFGAPLLISLTNGSARVLAPTRNKKETNRIKPSRESTVARRKIFAPVLIRFWLCSLAGFHSLGTTGSINTSPATSSGYRAAKSRVVSPPKECPTRMKGGQT